MDNTSAHAAMGGEDTTRSFEGIKDELLEDIIRGESYESLVDKLSSRVSHEAAHKMVTSAFAEFDEIKKSGRLTDLEHEIFFKPKDRKKSLLSDRGSSPKGLGGWLILVGIGLALSPVLTIWVLSTSVPIFLNGSWTALTTPGSEAYNPLWGPILIFEIVGNIGFLAAGLWLLVLFFRRSQRFPELFIWLAFLSLAFIIIDAWFGSLVIPDEPMIDADTRRSLAASIRDIVIWVPYMLVSKRVKNTFVE